MYKRQGEGENGGCCWNCGEVIGMGAEGQCAWKLLIKPRNVAGQTLTEKSGHLMHFDG